MSAIKTAISRTAPDRCSVGTATTGYDGRFALEFEGEVPQTALLGLTATGKRSSVVRTDPDVTEQALEVATTGTIVVKLSGEDDLPVKENSPPPERARSLG